MSSDDDFENAGCNAELGPNWSTTRAGAGGFSVKATPITDFNLSLMPEWTPSERRFLRLHGSGDVGAIVSKDSRCTECRGPFLAGHCVTFHLKPKMAGTGHHIDCDDPTLERRKQ